MEQIKEAFYKVKQDIELLKNEISVLNKDLLETRKSLIEVCEILKEYSSKEGVKEKVKEKLESPLYEERLLLETPAHPPITLATPTHNPTHNEFQNPPNTQNMGISTGNQGVPTDRQTDRQTHQQTDKGSYNTQNSVKNILPENSIDNAIQILESLDQIKKELRLKFKRLTEQELLVFSTLYQSSEEEGYTDYKNLSEKLKLTESSIRDYVGRLIRKGISIEKIKINNKTIHLSISPNLKKVASLSTILQLRSL